MSLEKALIEYCSTTLAGLKLASLFCYKTNNLVQTQKDIKILNNALSSKGINIRILKCCSKACQIYVYRPKMLYEALQNKDIFIFLQAENYPMQMGLEAILEHLSIKFKSANKFPHELGFFLGYPYNDVVAFIQNNGKNFRLLGLWKVYEDINNALQLFNSYRKCREVYVKCYALGYTLTSLTVANK